MSTAALALVPGDYVTEVMYAPFGGYYAELRDAAGNLKDIVSLGNDLGEAERWLAENVPAGHRG